MNSNPIRNRSIDEISTWDAETDVLVIGLGCAGACAAIAASQAGAEVLVLERAGGGGGTSANSGGLLYLGGGTPVQEACGYEDSPDEMFDFLCHTSGPACDKEKIRLFCDQSVDHFRWLEELGLPFKRSDYDEPGMESMTDDCLTFTGGENCAPYSTLFTPIPRGHKPQTEGKAGPFLMRQLLAAVEQHPIEIEPNVLVEGLVSDHDGGVVGVVARSAGEERAYRARGGVILAAGGFALNKEMVADHVPQLARAKLKNATDGDDGRGIRMARAIGADMIRMDQAEVALPVTIPNTMSTGIYVNHQGQRFINEDNYHGHIGIEALFRQEGRVWFLMDDDTYQINMLGMQPTLVAESIAELEAEAGLPEGALQTTVDLYNRHAEKGEDPVFGKRRERIQPLDSPPFALFDCSPEETIYAAMTLGGLRTSKDGEVRTTEGRSIPGLYAAGRTAALFTGRGYSGSGISLTDASFYGRRAGRSAAARKG